MTGKFFYTNRVDNMWNSLPKGVVHAESYLKQDWINFGATRK